MTPATPQDPRSFFALPLSSEGDSYYRYGTPGFGAGQYCHPNTLSFILRLAHRWGAVEDRKIGIGNISLAGGASFPPHRSHRSGLEVDVRPIRKDGKQLPVRRSDAEYDRSATRKLVLEMWQTGMVKGIAFNDTSIPRVHWVAGHDDHLHVEIIA